MWTEITGPKYERTGLRYASDLTDAEWALIEPFLPPARGTPSAHEMTTRRVFYQKISPIKGHIVIYRAGLGRTRAGTHLVLPSSATGRSHLGNLG